MGKQSFFDAMEANKRNSVILALGLTALIFVVLFALTQLWGMGETGLFLGAFLALAYELLMYYPGV